MRVENYGNYKRESKLPVRYTHGKRKTNYDAKRNPAPCVLSLPSICPTVPVRYIEKQEDNILSFGLKLYEKGYIKESKKSLGKLLSEGTEKWIKSFFKDEDKISEFVVVVAGTNSVGNMEIDIPNKYKEKECNLLTVQFCNDLESAKVRNIENVLIMHEKNSGLAELVIKTLGISPHLHPVMTPAAFLEMVAYAEWMGCDDESEIMYEMEQEGEGFDSSEIVKKSDVYQCFPEWTMEACWKGYEEMVSSAKKAGLDEKGESLIDLCLKIIKKCDLTLKEVEKSDNICTEIEGMKFYDLCFFNDFSSVASLEYRIINEFYRSQMEGDTNEQCLVIVFNPEEGIDEVEKLMKDIGEIRCLFEGLFEAIEGW